MNSSRSSRVSCFVCDSQNTRCRVAISALRTHYTAMHSTSNKLDAKRMKGQKNNGEREEQERKTTQHTKTGREWINDWMTDGDVCLWDFLWCWFLLSATHTRNPPDWHDQRHLAITTPLDWSPFTPLAQPKRVESSPANIAGRKKIMQINVYHFSSGSRSLYKRA